MRELSVAAGAAIVLAGLAGPAMSADLLRGSRHYDGGYTEGRSRSCPTYEPSDYRPKTTNFGEPLCYAARPYGLSTKLYDISPDLQGPY